MPPLLPIAASLATAAAVSAATLHQGATSLSSNLFASSILCGSSTRRAIALTFDDGPSESTPYLLDLLASEQVPATFFQCGLNVQRLPQVARRAHAEGHELGNHTFSHLRLCPRIGYRMNFRSPGTIYSEIAHTQQILRDEAGVTPQLFRPPYGLRWFGLRAALDKLHLQSVLWSLIARDWELPAREIAALILTHTAPGAILCLHDGRDIRPNPDIAETLAALRIVIPALKQQGFAFETVGTLLAPPARL